MLRDLIARVFGPRLPRTNEIVLVDVEGPGAANPDVKAMKEEVEAEIERQRAAGADPATLRAAVEEIAARHGGILDTIDVLEK